tara:strand:+ start:667 stop:882 length:216 start_codon:yes stop_codon:yes gene_type:complete
VDVASATLLVLRWPSSGHRHSNSRDGQTEGNAEDMTDSELAETRRADSVPKALWLVWRGLCCPGWTEHRFT